MKRVKYSRTFIGILSVLCAIPYIMYLYGPIEQEVHNWGVVEFCIGITILLASTLDHFIQSRSYRKYFSLLLNYTIIANAVFQVIPMVLWFIFSGTGISDGSPQSQFVAHWGYSIIHVAIFVYSIVFFIQTAASRRPQQSS